MLLLPYATSVGTTAYADSLPGDYVDGELLVVYHSDSAQSNEGIAPLSDDSNPLEAACHTVDETWSMGSTATQEETITTLNLDDSFDTASPTTTPDDDVVVSLARSADKTPLT